MLRTVADLTDEQAAAQSRLPGWTRAEVLTHLTGSPYFPGGLGEFLAPANAFLKFELGPTTDVRLQWASYYDAADQAGLSRLYGGIHPAIDDFTGRIVGSQVGIGAWNRAAKYFDGTAVP